MENIDIKKIEIAIEPAHHSACCHSENHRKNQYRLPHERSRGTIYLQLVRFMALLLAAFVVGYMVGGKDPIPGNGATKHESVEPSVSPHRQVTLRTDDDEINIFDNDDGETSQSQTIVVMSSDDNIATARGGAIWIPA